MMSMDAKRIAFALLIVALAATGLTQTPEPGKKKEIKITWLGHSAFEIVSPGGTRIYDRPVPDQEIRAAEGTQGSCPLSSGLRSRHPFPWRSFRRCDRAGENE